MEFQHDKDEYLSRNGSAVGVMHLAEVLAAQ